MSTDFRNYVQLLIDNNKVTEADIRDRFDKIKAGLVKNLHLINKGRWLIQFSDDSNNFAAMLLKNEQFHIEKGSLRISVRAVKADVNTLDPSNHLRRYRDSLEACLGDETSSQNGASALETEGPSQATNSGISSRSKSSNRTDTRLASEKKYLDAGVRRVHIDCGNVSLHAYGFFKRDSAFLKSMKKQHRVNIEFRTMGDYDRPYIVVNGQENATLSAVSELLKKAGKLVVQQFKIGAAIAWLLNFSNAADQQLQQLFAEKNIVVSWTLDAAQFRANQQNEVDNFGLQTGATKLMNFDVTVSLCAENIEAFATFLDLLESMYIKERRPISQKTLTTDRWYHFQKQIVDEYPQEVYIQTDIGADTEATCTFIAESASLKVCISRFESFITSEREISSVFCCDNASLRFAQRFMSKELAEIEQTLKVRFEYFPCTIQISGSGKDVQHAEKTLLALFSTFLVSKMTFQEEIRKLLRNEQTVDDLKNRCKAHLILRNVYSYDENADYVDTLQHTINNVQIIVRRADILENFTDVVACFTDDRLSDKFGTIHALLLDKGGPKVVKECQGKKLQCGEIHVTGSGEIKNYKQIAHLCVTDGHISRKLIAEAHVTAIRNLFQFCSEKSYSSITMAVPREFVQEEVTNAVRLCSLDASNKVTQIHFVHPELEVADIFAAVICSAFSVRRMSKFLTYAGDHAYRQQIISQYKCFENGLRVTLACGTLCDVDAQMITTVSATCDVKFSGANDPVLLKAGSKTQQEIEQKLNATKKSSSFKMVVVDPGCLINCKFIAHGKLPRYEVAKALEHAKALRKYVKEALFCAVNRNLACLALSSLSFCKLDYPRSVVAHAILSALLKFKRVRDSKLLVRIVTPNDSEMLSAFRFEFCTPREKKNFFVRITNAETDDIVCRAECAGTSVMLLCAPPLTLSTSADVLLHSMTESLDGPVSAALLSAMRVSDAQLREQIAKAYSKHDVSCTLVQQNEIPYQYVMHAKLNAADMTDISTALLSTLQLCEELKLSSIAIHLMGIENQLGVVLIVINTFVVLSKRKFLNMIKLVDSTPREEEFQRKLESFSATATRQPLWKVLQCRKPLEIVVVHVDPQTPDLVKRDLETMLSNNTGNSNDAATHFTETSTDSDTDSESSPIVETIRGELFMSSHVLGFGNFGQVFKGILINESMRVVAVKRLIYSEKERCGDWRDLSDRLKKISHPNIVRVYECYFKDQTVLVTMEVVNKKSLLALLRERKEKVEDREALSWLSQLASGMVCLEREALVHGNLAARNVLMNSNMQLKISDGGFIVHSENLKDWRLSNKPAYLARWQAPERIAQQKNAFTSKADAWSFAVTSWEINNKGAIPTLPGQTSNDTEVLLSTLREGKRLATSSSCSASAFMKLCWSWEPESRPSFAEIESIICDLSAQSEVTHL